MPESDGLNYEAKNGTDTLDPTECSSRLLGTAVLFVAFPWGVECGECIIQQVRHP